MIYHCLQKSSQAHYDRMAESGGKGGLYGLSKKMSSGFVLGVYRGHNSNSMLRWGSKSRDTHHSATVTLRARIRELMAAL